MKKLLLILSILISFSLGGSAQTIKMCHNVTVYVQKYDGKNYLVLKMGYDDDKMPVPQSIFKMKLADGNVISLDGQIAASKMSGRNSNGGEEYTFFVKFEISNEQIEMLKRGVNSVFINTCPELHEDIFKDTSFSDKLYETLKNTPNKW